MTREEAKRELLFAKREVMAGSYIEKAYDMAIKALEQPEIIRCKECQYNTGLSKFIEDYYCCDYHEHIVRADDFCSDAKRREEGDE